MGERINDGGPAFPVGTIYSGMSLRDWLAGQILPAVLADPVLDTVAKQHNLSLETVTSRVAYGFADEMLATRQAGAPVSVPDGYTEAFYEIAALLGIGAKPYSPKEAFERDIKPRLQALLAAERGGA